VDVNTNQDKYLINLLREFKYYKSKRTSVLKLFKLLFENGLIISNVEKFIIELNWMHSTIESTNVDYINLFIKPLKDYFDENFMIELFNQRSFGDKGHLSKYLIKILNIDYYPELYKRIKQYYGKDFNIYFKDFIKDNSFYEDVTRYNI